MPVLARDVINDARDADPAFDKQSTPDQIALRFLAKHQQGLLTEVAQWKADAVHAEQAIDLPLDDFAEGEALDAHILVHGAAVIFTDAQRRPVPLTLVDYPSRLDQYAFPAGYVRAGTLFLLGEAGDWTDVASLSVDLFPQGPDVLTLATPLVLPGAPLRACSAALSAFMAVRASVTATDPVGAVSSYLDEVTGRRRVKVGATKEVW